jgi:hypothetical protein
MTDVGIPFHEAKNPLEEAGMRFLSEMEEVPDGPQDQLACPNGESIELSPQSRQLVLDWIIPISAVVVLIAFVISVASLLLGDQRV